MRIRGELTKWTRQRLSIGSRRPGEVKFMQISCSTYAQRKRLGELRRFISLGKIGKNEANQKRRELKNFDAFAFQLSSISHLLSLILPTFQSTLDVPKCSPKSESLASLSLHQKTSARRAKTRLSSSQEGFDEPDFPFRTSRVRNSFLPDSRHKTPPCLQQKRIGRVPFSSHYL